MSGKERKFYCSEAGQIKPAEYGTVLSADQHYADFRLEAERAGKGELVFAQTMAFGTPGRENEFW
ncbi:MAG: hypothetical protein A2857_01935 [Candidatus Levybacteria bacterium RIFCSPHIGHO2_01_FULL_36_15]|nr:MAG: hypothetical protein A2857_01935 [Candidatus Levybacteria bacterium RIFCSPHIGHO2_01_FULL_36_15]OGH38700.1 MAG: hypothetical protein A2905_02850 [Candidatus Levybacteria bacterium RIFCSPLOWO2_01_FULL_36_10]